MSIETINIHPRSGDYDIAVEGKADQTVMIIANAKGQRIVEDLWPDVEWARDAYFATYPGEWKFTHVRVTKMPPHLEATGIALAEAASDSLGFLVANSLQAFAEPRRVVHWVGEVPDVTANIDAERGAEGRKRALELFVEFVPATRTVAGSA